MESYLSWVRTDRIPGPRCVVEVARVWQGEAWPYLVTPAVGVGFCGQPLAGGAAPL